MPLKRYPEWQDLSFETENKKHPLVTRADDEETNKAPTKHQETPSEDATFKKPETHPDQPPYEETSPLLLYKQQMHIEVEEIKKNAPNYLAARKVERRESYHDATQDEKDLNELTWMILVFILGYLYPILACGVSGNKTLWAIYLGGALVVFLIDFFRSHSAGAKLSIEDVFVNPFFCSGSLLFVGSLFYWLWELICG